jgi:hypothetical protein
VLVNDWLVFSEASLQTVVARLSGAASGGEGADEADEPVEDEGGDE